VQVVKPESLSKTLNPISQAAFLLCEELSNTTSSSDPVNVAVMSVNSERSTFNVTLPEEPPPSNKVPAVTPVISPVQAIPAALLQPSSKLSSAAHEVTVVPLRTNLLLPMHTLPSSAKIISSPFLSIK